MRYPTWDDPVVNLDATLASIMLVDMSDDTPANQDDRRPSNEGTNQAINHELAY